MSGTDISAKIDEYAKTHIDELRSQESVKRQDMTKYDIASQMLANGMLTQAEFDSWAYGTKEGQDSYNERFDSPSAFGSGFAFGSFDSFNTYDNGTYLDDIAITLEQEKQASSVSSFFAAPKPEQNQPLPPHLAAQQKSQQTRTYAADKLYQQAGNAQDNLTDYYNSIGYISFDAVQQGLESIGNYTWDLLTGRNDFVTVYENAEALNNEIGGLIRLKNTTSPEEFNAKFKELYGIDYNEQAQYFRYSV